MYIIEADGLAERGSFIINPEGKVVMYEVIAGNVGRNADELFRRVQASQFVYEHGDEVMSSKMETRRRNIKTITRSSRINLKCLIFMMLLSLAVVLLDYPLRYI